MQKIENIIDASLHSFGTWLTEMDWLGREHDCVNNFAHAFLMKQISTGSVLHHPAQICLECGITQPSGYIKLTARRDLVIWSEPFHDTWSTDLKRRLHNPLALMEWKVNHKNRLPKQLFFPHDEEWITGYTRINTDVIGYVVAVYFLPEGKYVYWKKSKEGTFSELNGIREKCITRRCIQRPTVVDEL